MQIAAVGIPRHCALCAVLAVVAVTDDNATERARSLAKERPPAVVLETNKRPPICFGEDIADKPIWPRVAPRIENADTRQVFRRVRAIVVAEELIATTDCQSDGVFCHVALNCIASRPLEVCRDGDLLPVLSAAKEIDVGIARRQCIT